jgi:hypothetical protein
MWFVWRQRPRKEFTKEEDTKLNAAVARYGTKNWQIVADTLRGRFARECRDRWTNYLAINLGNEKKWTEGDDKLLKLLVTEYGQNWGEVSTLLQGRTPVSAKNRYYQLHNMLQKEDGSITEEDMEFIANGIFFSAFYMA